MLYNSIIMALTASQVLAQNPYNSDVLGSYMSIIAGSTAEPSPTVAPYVTPGSDGQATTFNPDESGDTSAQTDLSTTALPNDSANYDSPASSPATGEHTTDYTPAASEGSSQSESLSGSSSFPPAPSASLSNPPIYLHIKLEKDPTKCLAIFDTSHQFNTPVILKECYGSGHEAHWQMDVSQASAIKSRVYEDDKDEEWCLDAGMDDQSTDGQPVVINKCNVGLYYQNWQYTSDSHLIVYDRVRNLDLRDGDATGGGFLQNWGYTYGNRNQAWIIAPADNA